MHRLASFWPPADRTERDVPGGDAGRIDSRDIGGERLLGIIPTYFLRPPLATILVGSAVPPPLLIGAR
jgi:hypothetical protein